MSINLEDIPYNVRSSAITIVNITLLKINKSPQPILNMIREGKYSFNRLLPDPKHREILKDDVNRLNIYSGYDNSNPSEDIIKQRKLLAGFIAMKYNEMHPTNGIFRSELKGGRKSRKRSNKKRKTKKMKRGYFY
jgi:hypothetical protein